MAVSDWTGKNLCDKKIRAIGPDFYFMPGTLLRVPAVPSVAPLLTPLSVASGSRVASVGTVVGTVVGAVVGMVVGAVVGIVVGPTVGGSSVGAAPGRRQPVIRVAVRTKIVSKIPYFFMIYLLKILDSAILLPIARFLIREIISKGTQDF